MRTFLRVIIITANLLVSIALIMACAAGYVSPKYFWPVAILGLSFPVLFALNALFGLFWLFRWKKEIVISLIALSFSIWNVPKFAAFNASNDRPPEFSDTLRVMTYNVHLFSQYDEGPDQKDDMLDFIRSKNADILCLQEFFVMGKKLSESEIMQHFSKYPYSYINYTSGSLSRKVKSGTAIFSKYPIINKKKVAFRKETSNSSIFADLKVGKDTIRVFCNHLESVRLKDVDKPNRWMGRIANNDVSTSNIKAIIRKLKRAYILRSEQVDSIKSAINRSSRPTILCGDFNDSPASYTYNTIKGKMSDAFVESGNGITQTYKGLIPTMRIDFVFSDKDFRAYRYQCPKVAYSDHYPIIVDFYINKPDNLQ